MIHALPVGSRLVRALTAALAAATMVSLGAAACGYRPAGSLLDEGEHAALVPAFLSSIPYPELDVYAGSYLASRLSAMGVRPTSNPALAERTVQGYLLATRELPLVLGSDATVVELAVDVRVEVRDAGSASPCRTALVTGRATLPLSLGAVSEIQRQTALQDAASEAIEALLLDTLLCLTGDAGPADPGPADPD